MADIEAIIKRSQEGLAANLLTTVSFTVMGSVNATMVEFQRVNIDKFNLQDNKIESIQQNLQVHHDEFNELKLELDELKKEMDAIRQLLGTSKGPSLSAPPLDSSWCRAPRADVLNIGLSDFTSKAELTKTIEEWLSTESNLTDQVWRLDGPELGRKFDLFFHGNPNTPDTGKKRAELANLSLRKSDGTWTKKFTKGPEDERVELFISKDDSPKANREITLGKRLFKAFEKVHGADKSIYFHKLAKTIKYKGKPVAKVECESFEKFDIKWIQDMVESLNLPKAEIIAEFHRHVGIAANHAWVV